MATEDACKLFVAGLPDSVTEDVLREIFAAVGGTVVDVSLPRDRATGRPRGFGFVTFSTAEEASNARQALDGSLQAGRSISVRPFSSEPPRRGETRDAGGGGGGPGGGGGAGEDRTLYVGNLPYDASQQEVIGFLGEHGVTAIARVHLPAGPDGRPRGFGFVTLQSAEAANEAIISLRGVEVRGRRLLVNIAHPRGASPGGGGGGRGFGPRPAEGGGWSPSGFPGPPPDPASASNRPDSRRRSGTGGPAEGGEEGAADRNKKKKRGAQGKGRAAPPERGGGGNWRSWNRDDED
jgi:RNA recognition motif-containing protein